MFAIENLTKTKILDVVVLSQKNRQPDDNPGMKVSVEQTLSNETLAFFDGRLKSAMYTKSGTPPAVKQGELEGVPAISDTPNLTTLGQHIGKIKGDWEWTGYTFAVDQGLGGKSNLEVTDCILSNFRLTFKEGGSYVAKYSIESPDASESMFGKFAKLKSREVDTTLLPPTSSQRDLTEKPAKQSKAKPTGNEAGDAFAGVHAAH